MFLYYFLFLNKKKLIMGIINDVFSENKLSLKKFGEILNDLIKNPNNKIILQDIGLIKEYLQIISDKEPDLLVYYSCNHKIIKNLKFLSRMRSNFLEWVKYLFDINKEDLGSVNKLNIKIEQIKLKPLTKEFFINNLNKYIFSSKSLKKLINYGIPPNLRLFIWDTIISIKYNNHKIFNYDLELKEYRALLINQKSSPQIEKDIHRTFIKEEERKPNYIQMLKNILTCINNYKYNNTGYCQGMNYIVGFLLKITNYNEVMAFYFFKSILKDIKGYFDEGFSLLNKNTKIFENYFSENYPKIYKHFKKNEIINEFYITKWLQTIFTLSLPFEELSIIWDILLIKGFDFIIFICLAFFDFIGDDLLKLKESADIINYLEKALNSEGESLIPINVTFFEQIDEYIISINEIIEKAQDIEKKINNNINEGNNRNIYDKKLSDNQLNLTSFQNLSASKSEQHFTNKNTFDKIPKPISLSYNQKNVNNNIHTINQPKISLFAQKIDEKPNYYSTKNLGIYQFNINNNNNFYQVPNQVNNNNIYFQNNNNPNIIFNSNKFLNYRP